MCVIFSLEVAKKSSQLNKKEIQFQLKFTNFIYKTNIIKQKERISMFMCTFQKT